MLTHSIIILQKSTYREPLTQYKNLFPYKNETQIPSLYSADGEKEINLNPHAKRDFKEIRLPLNEFEFKLLDEKSKKTGRSRLNFIRWAVTQIDVS